MVVSHGQLIGSGVAAVLVIFSCLSRMIGFSRAEDANYFVANTRPPDAFPHNPFLRGSRAGD